MVERLPYDWGKATYLAQFIDFYAKSVSKENNRKVPRMLRQLQMLLTKLYKHPVKIKKNTYKTVLGPRLDWSITTKGFSEKFIDLSNAVLGLYAHKHGKYAEQYRDYSEAYLKTVDKHAKEWRKEFNLQ
jgi:hypothetical protein